MKISVITVCYNSGKTVERTLKSVAEQDFPNTEHIVIDGGSNDDTLKIIGRFRSKLACVVSEPDAGIYDAMNKGIQRSSGDFICFLNSDDIYPDDNVLSRVANQLREGEIDMIFGNVDFFNSSSPDMIVRRYRSDKFYPGKLAWGWMPAHPSMFISRKIYVELNGFNSDYRIAGDFEFVARMFKKFKVKYKYIPEVIVKMQTGGVSTSPGIAGRLLHNREILRACAENGISTNLIKILSRYPLKLLELF